MEQPSDGGGMEEKTDGRMGRERDGEGVKDRDETLVANTGKKKALP